MIFTLFLVVRSATTPAPESFLWVARDFMGGPKCATSGPVHHFEAPGFEGEKSRLKATKVPVVRAYFRDYATCEACQVCPRYKRAIFFEIREADLPQAEKAGYKKAIPPSPEELTEFEDAKRYRPAPDRPPEE